MTTEITKTWLRRQFRQEETAKSFKAWCKVEGKSYVETYLESSDCTEKYPDGVNLAVAQLTGVEEGDASALKRMDLEEKQRARRAISLSKSAAAKVKSQAKRSRK